MTAMHDFGAMKYGASGLLFSSADRGWSSLSAELRNHRDGTIEWRNPQLDTEICVDICGNRSNILRRGGGIFDQAVAERGRIWLSPAGLREDVIDISDPVPGILHIYLPSGHFSPSSLGVDFDKSVLSGLRYEASFRDPLLAEIAYAVVAELKEQTCTGKMLVETLATSLAARLVHRHVSPSGVMTFPQISREGLDRRRLARVLEFIEENLEGELAVEHLASIACLSRFHFTRAFKAAVGQSPHRYVNVKRLARAKELLIRDDQSLTTIALTLNYSSQADFTRAFRRMTGQTPGQFRRSLTNPRIVL